MSHILRFSLRHSVLPFGMCLPKYYILTNKPPTYVIYKIQNYQPSLKNRVNIIKRIQGFERIVRDSGHIPFKEMEKVLLLLKLTGSISPGDSLSMITSCSRITQEESIEKRVKLIEEVWDTCKELGTVTTINHYNNIMKVYVEREYPFSPADFLTEINKKGFEPNEMTYELLITRYCQLGDIAGATKILELMKKKNMAIDEPIFNALILGHSQANDMESAENVLNIMKQGGFKPSSCTFTALICGYIRAGQLDRVREIRKGCEIRDSYFYHVHYLQMLYYFSVYGYDDEFDKMLACVKRNPGYNSVALKYIYKLFDVDKLDSAFKILKTMIRRNRSDGVQLSLGYFFLSQLVRVNAPEEQIARYCVELIEIDLNPKALSIVVDCCLQAGNEEKALKCLEHAKEMKLTLKQHDFWPVLTATAAKKDKSAMFDVLQTMNRRFGFIPNVQTVCYYVLPCVFEPNMDIKLLWNELKPFSISFPVLICSTVIHLLGSNEIQQAANIATTYKAYYPLRLIRKPLINSYLNTKDLSSFTTVLKEFADRFSSVSVINDPEEAKHSDAFKLQTCIGEIIIEMVKLLKSRPSCVEEVKNLLQALISNDLVMDAESSKFIENILREKYTPEIAALLEKSAEKKCCVASSN